ncbi:MAG: YdcF family protein [Pseudomonadota bacterium]
MRLLLTPVVVLFVGLLLLAVLTTAQRLKWTSRLAWILAALLYLSTAPLPVNLVAKAIAISPSADCASAWPDSIFIVLTGGASGSARRSDEIWRLDLPTFRRLVRATELARGSAGSRLLISGGAEVGLTNEGRMAQEFVLRLGWPADRLAIEDRSTDTITSAAEVASMLGADPTASKLILVTSSLHMRRAAFAYRQAGVNVLACPVDDPDSGLIFPDSLVPQAAPLQKLSQAWKEVIGLIVYAIRRPLPQ